MRRTAGLLIATALASTLHAQRIREQVTVSVIEVPVNVTRNGKAVSGLDIGDFELYVNGVRHPIKYFDAIEAAPASGPAGKSIEPALPLDRRRLVVLLFDTKTTSHRGIERAKEAAEHYVEQALPRETFAVARLTRNGIEWIVPFTTDRVAIQRAVATLRPSRAGDAFNLAMLPSERVTIDSGGTISEPEPPSTVAADAAIPFPTSGAAIAQAALEYEEKVNALQRHEEQNRVTDHLSGLADRLAPLSGVKHVVFLSEGEAGGADVRRATRMHERFQAAGVVLDAVEIDAMHVPNYRPVAGQVNRSRPRLLAPENDKMASLYTLALGTGGSVTKHGDIRTALRDLSDMQKVTYVLGFQPPDDQKKHNTISVRVLRQPFGTTVNHRRGYSAEPHGDRGDAIFLADVLMNDIDQQGITVDLGVQRNGGDVTFVASLPGPELLARNDEKQEAILDVFFYVFDETNAPAAWAYSRLRLDLTKAREFLQTNPYTIRKQFQLAAGTYSAKALVRVVDSDLTGFQRSNFEVR